MGFFDIFKHDLGKMQRRKNLKGLIKVLLRNKNVHYRKIAAESLGAIGDGAAVEPLVKALDDSAESVRIQAFKSLGKLKDLRALEPLFEAALRNMHHYDKKIEHDLKTVIAQAMCELNAPRAVELIGERLKYYRGWNRLRAAELFGILKDKLRDPIALDSLALDSLAVGLGDPDFHVRYETADALGYIGDPRTIEPLIAALKDPDSTTVRSSAGEALGRIKDPRAVEPLITTLKDPDSSVRNSAVEALGSIKDPRAVEPLIAAMHDSESYIRYYAMLALGGIKDPRAIDPLIEALNDSDIAHVGAAALALIEIGDLRGIMALEGVLPRLRPPFEGRIISGHFGSGGQYLSGGSNEMVVHEDPDGYVREAIKKALAGLRKTGEGAI